MDNVHNATDDSHKWLWQATEQVFTGCRTKEYTNGQVYYGQVFTHFVSLHLSAADTMVSIKTTTIVLRPFVRDYPGEPVPEETLTHPPSWSSSNLYQLLPLTVLWSIPSSLFKLRAWQSFCTTSLHVLFGLPLGLEPSTSYSVHIGKQ